MFLKRVLFGGAAALAAGAVGGPIAAYAGWKGVGAVVTGNPLYLVPGTSILNETTSIASDLLHSGAEVTALGTPEAHDIWGRQEVDVQGNPV
ncbi:hypothetical protein V6768_27540 [Tistrella mobilis]